MLTPLSNFIQRATNLLNRGLSVIPAKPKSKEPIAGLGVRSRSKDPAVIAEWADRYPNANVAACADGNVVILDADDAEAMEREIGKVATYTVQSSPGKAHYYFKVGKFPVRNLELGVLGSLRADNMYVIGEGSIHPKTGEPYKCIKEAQLAVLQEDMYRYLEALAATAKRHVDAVSVNWDGKTVFNEGERHYFLRSQAGKLWDGAKTEEDLFAELSALNEKFCNPPKSESAVLGLVTWVMTKEPCETKGPVVLIGAPRDHEGFVFGAHPNEIDGLFPFGELSLIYGASGAGKTTLGVQMLIAQADREPFFGRDSYGYRFVVVLQDRSAKALGRTLRRMGVPDLPVEALKGNPVACIQSAILKHQHPAVVFFEGADMAMDGDKALSMGAVNKFVDELRGVAEHHGVALIATVGSPKLKVKEAYRNPRDMAFGSSCWSRKSETVIGVQEDFQTGRRHVYVMPRNAKASDHTMEFHNGRLREVFDPEPSIVVDIGSSGAERAHAEWWATHPNARATEAAEVFNVSDRQVRRWRRTLRPKPPV